MLVYKSRATKKGRTLSLLLVRDPAIYWMEWTCMHTNTQTPYYVHCTLTTPRTKKPTQLHVQRKPMWASHAGVYAHKWYLPTVTKKLRVPHRQNNAITRQNHPNHPWTLHISFSYLHIMKLHTIKLLRQKGKCKLQPYTNVRVAPFYFVCTAALTLAY